jgi:prolyl 4-hydroxylase
VELQIERAPATENAMNVLCESPRVILAIGVVSTELTSALVALAEPRICRALVSGEDGGTFSSGRSCEVTWLMHDEDPVVRSVVDTVANVAGLDSRLAERLQIIRYSKGGEYKPHFDSYDLTTERGRRCTAGRGQRTRTALLYLNDGFEGGATRFPRLGLEVRPLRGAVLTFDNCQIGGTLRDDKSLHAGLPVEDGEKWVGTLWFRER